MSRILVTGAVGFIGGHCCRALFDAGHEVVGLDNFDPFYDSNTAASGIEPQIEHLPSQPGDVKRMYADISKARRVLGYEPRITIDDGIPAFVAWYEGTYGR